MPQLTGTANRLLTDDKLMRESMRLLKNNLVAARLINRSAAQEFTKPRKIGETINIKKPFRVKVRTNRTYSAKPLIDESVAITVDKIVGVDLEFEQEDRTLSINEFSSRYLSSAMSAIAHEVDRDLLTNLQQSAFYGSGTPGTAISSNNFNRAYAMMEKVGHPTDSMTSAVIDPEDRAEIDIALKGHYNEKIVADAIKKSYMGPLAGIECFSTAQQPTHTVGAHGGTPLVNGATQSGTSLVTDGWPNSTAVLNVGDQFTIANVFEVNPQTYQSTGRLQRFTVTAAATSNGSGQATLSISPGINDGSNTALDGDGNNVSLAAYQNVTAEPADNAAITVIGTASTAYRSATLFHRDAMMFVPVPISLPESAHIKERVTDPDSGLSLLMTADYDITNFKQKYRIDFLYGRKAVYPELIHRVWSA